MNLLSRHPQCEIHCGSLDFFRDWIGRQPGMRSVPADEVPVPMYAGVMVVENPLIPRNVVMFKTGTEIKVFTLDE